MDCSFKTAIINIVMAELGCSGVAELEEMARTNMTGKAKEKIEALIDAYKKELIMHEQGQEYPSDAKQKFSIAVSSGKVFNFDPSDMVKKGFYIDRDDLFEIVQQCSGESDENVSDIVISSMDRITEMLPFEADVKEVGVASILVKAKSLDTLKELINPHGRVVINFLEIYDSLKKLDW